MFEKVNPMHPDKVADRIAGAMVDYAYKIEENPKIAVEVLIGHGKCLIIAETSVTIPLEFVEATVERISGVKGVEVDYKEVPQDEHLAGNQAEEIKCGDNGIFKGVPMTRREKKLSKAAKELYKKYPTDGKFIIRDGLALDEFIICQSNAEEGELDDYLCDHILDVNDQIAAVNPLGEWTGGIDVDSGATNRKLGSDMGQSVTGGGLHGKDLSKADVSVNIYAFNKAQETGKVVEISCAIGDTEIDGKPYAEIVEEAKKYIANRGGFEKFAEWGLV